MNAGSKIPQNETYRPVCGTMDMTMLDLNDAKYEEDTTGFPAIPEIWESVIAMPTFKDRQLTEFKLYPISLGFGSPRQVRGRPLLADRELGKKIIADLQALSAPFGTKIEMRRGVGYVTLTPGD